MSLSTDAGFKPLLSQAILAAGGMDMSPVMQSCDMPVGEKNNSNTTLFFHVSQTHPSRYNHLAYSSIIVVAHGRKKVML